MLHCVALIRGYVTNSCSEASVSVSSLVFAHCVLVVSVDLVVSIWFDWIDSVCPVSH